VAYTQWAVATTEVETKVQSVKQPSAVAEPTKPQEEKPSLIVQTGVSFTAGIVAAWLTTAILEFRSRRVSRKRLMKAIAIEANLSIEAMKPVIEAANETLKYAEQVHEAVLGGKSFDMVTKLYSGWVNYAPSVPFLESIERVEENEARAIIKYLDHWGRFQEIEKRYATALDELLKCLPDNPGQCGLRTQDLADQVRENLRELCRVATQIKDEAHEIEKLAAKIR
jgi:hypothetical protein